MGDVVRCVWGCLEHGALGAVCERDKLQICYVVEFFSDGVVLASQIGVFRSLDRVSTARYVSVAHGVPVF